ncbi:MAG: hypothetical protein B7X10_03650 [Burkholderiales bacterium 21-58-4]|nr:MAG: hypothetical protein B7X10_03650 [Burkholderiales bacterium 21-58-4]
MTPSIDRPAIAAIWPTLRGESIVLDVGANRGQFAQELRSIGYKGLIVSFEPIKSEFLAMEREFENDSNWRGYQIALGSREESMVITVPEFSLFSSFLEFESSIAHFERDARKELVEVRRLDGIFPSLMQEFGFSSVFLKMDTQGYDLEVFKGASGCIESIRGIESELSIQPIYKNMPHYLEALEAYEAEGFDLYNLSVVNRVGNGGLLELNCLMRRA